MGPGLKTTRTGMGLGGGGGREKLFLKIFDQFSYLLGHSVIHVIIKETFEFLRNNSMKYILNILTLLSDSCAC